ncbi:ROK family protein [Bauldia litoralis]|uniref:ROK family protein n=1 Tax=Bauldia litoralis TaxID=665467 RepID=UPI0032972E72
MVLKASGEPRSDDARDDSPRRGKGRPRTSDGATQSLAAILELVRQGAASTRQEIERESELGRAIVADRLATLTALGLVDESELGTASGGRAPRLVRFREQAARVLVATLDQTAIGIGLADLSGRLLMEHHEAMDLALGPAAVLDRLCAVFDWVLEKHLDGSTVWGIGISAPGPVPIADDSRFPAQTPAFLPAWDAFPFVESLIARYESPVWLRSSVETMTMGELKAGAGANLQNMLFIKVGKRIGAGIVFEGRLYRGAQGAAGLIGQLPVHAGGQGGTIETLAGSDYIEREGIAAASEGKSAYLADIVRRGGEITAIEVGQAAQMGDAAGMEIMSRAGHVLGHSVATLANMLNPALIVLSGSIVQTNDILLAAVRETVYGESHPMVTRDLRILRSQLGSSAGLVGAAMVVVDGLFDHATLRGWILNGSPLRHPEFAEAMTNAGQRTQAMGGGSETEPGNSRGAPDGARLS